MRISILRLGLAVRYGSRRARTDATSSCDQTQPVDGNTRKAAMIVAAAGLLLAPAAAALAGAIELTGHITSCDPAGCEPGVEVGTETYTRVTFDHSGIDRVGRYAYPIGWLHGSLDISIDGEHWTEQNDIGYWNELYPWSPRHGWYSPRLVFEDGFQFHLDDRRVEGGSYGTLADVLPPYLPEPGTLLMVASGLAGCFGTRRSRPGRHWHVACCNMRSETSAAHLASPG